VSAAFRGPAAGAGGDGTGRHTVSRVPANDPFMTTIVLALILLPALVCLLAAGGA
jgi:hypothetical protein